MSKPKGKNNETYSHPLIKDIYHLAQQPLSPVPPSYLPVIPDHTHRISSKIMRYAVIPNANNQSQILLSANLFGNSVQSLPLVQQTISCKQCKTMINPLWKVANHMEFICNLCQKATFIQTTNCDELLNLNGYRIQNGSSLAHSQKLVKQNTENAYKKRRILFVIQASEYIYENNLHSSIFSCLKALNLDQLQIGFILFNDKQVMFLKPCTLELTMVKLINNESFSDWKALPIDQDQLFMTIGAQMEQIQQLVATIMYQAFFIKQSLVGEVTKMLDMLISKQTQIKCFISTLNQSQTQAIPETVSSVFKEKQNTIQDNIAQKLPFLYQTKVKKTTKLIKNNPNLNFFVINGNAAYKEVVNECLYNLIKIYNPKQGQYIQNQLYYDLFSNITQKRQINVQVLVSTSKEIKLSTGSSLTDSLFERITIRQEDSDMMNRYRVTINQADTSFCLPLQFIFNEAQNTSQKPFIQISYEFKNDEQLNQLVVMNVKPQIDKTSNWLENIDDELVFNHQLRKCIAMWDQQSYKQVKQALFNQYLNVVRLFIDLNGSNIIFPKNWKHYLLYSHLLQQKISSGALNFYQIYKILNKNIQSLSKYFYYRTYKLEDDIVKNIKFTDSIFQKYQMVFIENGEFLYLVMKEPSVQDVKEIFGYYDTISSLAKQHLQLPILQSNEKYRSAIQTIRNLHEYNFLPLKIVDYQGCSFESLIKKNLYQKDKHLSFLRRAWRQA